MYLPQIILARNISIEVPRRGGRPLKLPQPIATLHALPLSDSIHRLDRCVSGSRQSLRGITPLSL